MRTVCSRPAVRLGPGMLRTVLSMRRDGCRHAAIAAVHGIDEDLVRWHLSQLGRMPADGWTDYDLDELLRRVDVGEDLLTIAVEIGTSARALQDTLARLGVAGFDMPPARRRTPASPHAHFERALRLEAGRPGSEGRLLPRTLPPSWAFS